MSQIKSKNKYYSIFYFIEIESNISILLLSMLLFSCDGGSSYPIANYNKSSNNFKVSYGVIQYDTLPKNFKTHKIIEGDKYILEYNNTGTTFVDAYNFEAKFAETLLFEIDTVSQKFKYCDESLTEINCRFYWICIASDCKKEIRDVKKGCIQGEIKGDTLTVEIDIDTGFKHGRILEADNNSLIKYKTSLTLNNIKNKNP